MARVNALTAFKMAKRVCEREDNITSAVKYRNI